jgi:hypothetical protein
MKFAIALIGLVSLAGCGVAAKIDPRANARADYQKSIDDEYRACINDNLKNVDKCQAKRLLMEANEHPPNNVAAGIAQRGDTNMTAVITQHTTAAAATTGAMQGTITRAGIIEDAIKRGIIQSADATTNDVVHPESAHASSMPNPIPF